MAYFRERPFDAPWRKVYEARALVAWLISISISVFFLFTLNLPRQPIVLSIIITICFIGWRLSAVLDIWDLKMSLLGKGLLLQPTETTRTILKEHPEQFFAGYGFDWTLEHSQRLYDLKKVDLKELETPNWYKSLRGVVYEQSNYERDVGSPFVHGVEPNEQKLYVPLKHLAGHTAIFGTTGSGKTRLFEFIVSQAIWRGDVVIVIDPKGDNELRERIEKECARAGRAKDYAMFHVAFPKQSVFFDPMSNFNRPTELASRIASLMPADSANDAFVSFNWRVANIISLALLEIDKRPNLKKLRKYVEGDLDQLVEDCLLNHFQKVGVEGWQSQIAQYKLRASNGEFAKPSKTTRDEIMAYIEYYRQEVAHKARSETLDSLINMFFHDRTHLSKMITTLLPILEMLTASDLGKLLSPDHSDINETREILNMSKVIESNRVFYMGLDALSDQTVCNAIATISVADLAATAGQIYNYQSDSHKKRITFVIDEASAALSPPFIEIANKGRGAGIEMTMATQVLADIVSRLGSEEKGRQVLGNFNNVIALRSPDIKTQEYMIERIGKTYIGQMQFSIGTSGSSTAAATQFQSNEGARFAEELIELVPPDVFGQLPNMHYFGVFSGGRLIKARFPIFTD